MLELYTLSHWPYLKLVLVLYTGFIEEFLSHQVYHSLLEVFLKSMVTASGFEMISKLHLSEYGEIKNVIKIIEGISNSIQK